MYKKIIATLYHSEFGFEVYPKKCEKNIACMKMVNLGSPEVIWTKCDFYCGMLSASGSEGSAADIEVGCNRPNSYDFINGD